MNNETYIEMKRRQQAEFNSFPIKFAFSDKQFEQGMRELGLTPDDTDKVYKTDGGGFYRRDDAHRLHEMMNRFGKELEAAIAADTTGEGFIYGMFLYELRNHEFGYTWELDDTLEALGYTEQDIEKNPALKRGLDKAIERISQEDD